MTVLTLLAAVYVCNINLIITHQILYHTSLNDKLQIFIRNKDGSFTIRIKTKLDTKPDIDTTEHI